MMNDAEQLLITHRVMPCLLCGLIFCGPSLSQDRDLDAIQEEDLQELFDQKIAATHWVPSPRTRALALLENYELVAVGEFGPLPGASPHLHADDHQTGRDHAIGAHHQRAGVKTRQETPPPGRRRPRLLRFNARDELGREIFEVTGRRSLVALELKQFLESVEIFF